MLFLQSLYVPFQFKEFFHLLVKYRACVVDLLGVGIIMCGIYCVYKQSSSCQLPFCTSPIFHFEIGDFSVYLSPHFLWSAM